MKKSTINKLLQLNYELYEHQAQSFSDTRQEIWEKPILDLVKTIKPKSKVLDLGCGNTRLYQILADKEIDYLGIDPSKTLIKLNQTKYPEARFEIGDGLKIKYKNTFDYIISLAVLHHIPSEKLQLKFLKNIYHALRSKGKILLSVWNRHQDKYQKYFSQKYKSAIIKSNPRQSALFSASVCELGRSDLIVPWKDSGYLRYIHAFTKEELIKLAKRAGFINIQCFYADKYGKSDKEKGLNIYLIASRS